MKYLIFLLTALCLFSCSKIKVDSSVPNAVKNKIQSFGRKACRDASAEEYLFLKQTVYVLSPGTCGADMQAEVVDVDANTLGFLGGIAGNMIIQNTSFDSAVFVKTVWKK